MRQDEKHRAITMCPKVNLHHCGALSDSDYPRSRMWRAAHTPKNYHVRLRQEDIRARLHTQILLKDTPPKKGLNWSVTRITCEFCCQAGRQKNTQKGTHAHTELGHCRASWKTSSLAQSIGAKWEDEKLVQAAKYTFHAAKGIVDGEISAGARRDGEDVTAHSIFNCHPVSTRRKPPPRVVQRSTRPKHQ